MVKVGLLARLVAKPGKEEEVAAFLSGALPLAEAERSTVVWFAVRISKSEFGIFDAFTSDNDPHGERDFGSFAICGEHLFWKIDYYDQGLRFGSEDPSDPAVTRRIMTIMLASEY